MNAADNAADPLESPSLEPLRTALESSGALSNVHAADGIVFGLADLPAVDAQLIVNVDPELEERTAAQIDSAVLIGHIKGLLAQTPEDWQAIVEATIDELIEAEEFEEESAQDEDLMAALRDDMELTSVAVLHEAVLLEFAAEETLPDHWVRVQLDEDLDVFAAMLDEKDEDEDDTLVFDSLDDLLAHLEGEEH